eukprot:gene3991-8418_t
MTASSSNDNNQQYAEHRTAPIWSEVPFLFDKRRLLRLANLPSDINEQALETFVSQQCSVQLESIHLEKQGHFAADQFMFLVKLTTFLYAILRSRVSKNLAILLLTYTVFSVPPKGKDPNVRILLPHNVDVEAMRNKIEGARFVDRHITVTPARPDGLLFFGNLSNTMTPRRLYEIGRYSGAIARVFVMLDEETLEGLGYGFIEYVNKPTAIKARADLASRIVDDRPIRVDLMRPTDNDISHFRSRTLFIDRLPKQLQDSNRLRLLFERSGKVEFCQLVTVDGVCRGFAFIDMASHHDAMRARKLFNGFVVEGNGIRVSFGHPQKTGQSIMHGKGEVAKAKARAKRGSTQVAVAHPQHLPKPISTTTSSINSSGFNLATKTQYINENFRQTAKTTQERQSLRPDDSSNSRLMTEGWRPNINHNNHKQVQGSNSSGISDRHHPRRPTLPELCQNEMFLPTNLIPSSSTGHLHTLDPNVNSVNISSSSSSSSSSSPSSSTWTPLLNIHQYATIQTSIDESMPKMHLREYFPSYLINHSTQHSENTRTGHEIENVYESNSRAMNQTDACNQQRVQLWNANAHLKTQATSNNAHETMHNTDAHHLMTSLTYCNESVVSGSYINARNNPVFASTPPYDCYSVHSQSQQQAQSGYEITQILRGPFQPFYSAASSISSDVHTNHFSIETTENPEAPHQDANCTQASYLPLRNIPAPYFDSLMYNQVPCDAITFPMSQHTEWANVPSYCPRNSHNTASNDYREKSTNHKDEQRLNSNLSDLVLATSINSENQPKAVENPSQILTSANKFCNINVAQIKCETTSTSSFSPLGPSPKLKLMNNTRDFPSKEIIQEQLAKSNTKENDFCGPLYLQELSQFVTPSKMQAIWRSSLFTDIPLHNHKTSRDSLGGTVVSPLKTTSVSPIGPPRSKVVNFDPGNMGWQ